jgi:hypothetical protein
MSRIAITVEFEKPDGVTAIQCAQFVEQRLRDTGGWNSVPQIAQDPTLQVTEFVKVRS